MNPLAAEKAKNSPAKALPARLRESVEEYGERLDLDLIVHAYHFSEKAHSGQKRASGEEYVAHCLEVAKIVTDLHLDTTSIA
ncbi:MAG TPA: HD domain-containing protein, partial [Longimicrobiales bacterium]|nr:HD domain-containing protein [Longimicrobiales bacterium]